MRPIQSSLKISVVALVVGFIFFYGYQGLEAALWFGLGGLLANLNLLVAARVVVRGLSTIRKKAILLTVLLFKSLSFIALVAMLLMFFKARVFAFTCGVSLVIFSLVIWAVWNSRQPQVKIE